MKTSSKQLKQIITVLEKCYDTFPSITTYNVADFSKRSNVCNDFIGCVTMLIDLTELPQTVLSIDIDDDFKKSGRYIAEVPTDKRYFINKPAIRNYVDDLKTGLTDVIVIDVPALYPTIFANAFTNRTFFVDIKGFAELYVFLYQNSKAIQQLSDKGYSVAKFILNSFYGILTTKSASVMKVSKNSNNPILSFYENLWHNVDVDKCLLYNVDLFIISISETDLANNILFFFYEMFNLSNIDCLAILSKDNQVFDDLRSYIRSIGITESPRRK